MADETQCRLCAGRSSLIQSHIIPSFVFARQKEASSTGYLRFGQSPNLRQQDGLKLPFLCGSCEQRFNHWETRFATSLFYPFHDRQSPPLHYGTWLAKFSASVVWRAMTYLMELGCLKNLSADLANEAKQTSEVWKSFLLDGQSDVGYHEFHLLPLDTIEETTTADWPSKINRYFLCASEIDLLSSETTAVVIVKMLRLVLTGFVREPEADRWQGTRIDLAAGCVAPCQLHVPDWLGTYFRQRAKRLSQLESSISKKQKRKIETAQSSQRERVLNSETMRAFLADRWLFEMNEDQKSGDDQ